MGVVGTEHIPRAENHNMLKRSEFEGIDQWWRHWLSGIQLAEDKGVTLSTFTNPA